MFHLFRSLWSTGDDFLLLFPLIHAHFLRLNQFSLCSTPHATVNETHSQQNVLNNILHEDRARSEKIQFNEAWRHVCFCFSWAQHRQSERDRWNFVSYQSIKLKQEKWKWFCWICWWFLWAKRCTTHTHSTVRRQVKMNERFLFFDKKIYCKTENRVYKWTIATGLRIVRLCKSDRFFPDETINCYYYAVYSVYIHTRIHYVLCFLWLIWLNVNLHHFNGIKSIV